MIARRLGRSVVLLEKFHHPRFAIGESATPLANLLLEELANRYDLPRLLPLTKWGSWRRTYPEIACGLKRGFTFYHHTFGKHFAADSDHSNQLLVAASPRDNIADTHWYRADFDHFLVCEAQKLGVEYLDDVTINSVTQSGDGFELVAMREGKPLSIRAGFLMDASGPRGFLHRIFQLPEIATPVLLRTQGLYTHFHNVRRLSDMRIHLTDEMPPYPVDDAAVHHVFDGGWIWVLRFNNGIISAGVAAVDRLAEELRFAEGLPAWERLLQRLPTVREQFADAKPQLPFVHSPRLSFHSGLVAGHRWALLPSAAGFVDPILSTGFPLTLLGIARLAQIIEKSSDSEIVTALKIYQEQTLKELTATEALVSALYANMNDFSLFTALSLLYFAAASFTEAARRLERSHLAGSFLLTDHALFGPRARSIFHKAMGSLAPGEKAALADEIQQAIEPVNVAGLGNGDRKNWYPVEAIDLLNGAAKLTAGKQEIHQLLIRSGFVIPPERRTLRRQS